MNYNLLAKLSHSCAVLALLNPASVSAWVINIAPGTRSVYLAVGTATTNADNSNINLLSATLSTASLTGGGAQVFTSNSLQANSPLDAYPVCTPTAGQVYIGGFYRLPTANATTAVLQVSTPAGLTSGVNTIAFNQISWTSTALGNAAADIPAGTFVSGGTLFLRNFNSNSYVENCHTFSYANTAPVAAGIYDGRATYTLTAP